MTSYRKAFCHRLLPSNKFSLLRLLKAAVLQRQRCLASVATSLPSSSGLSANDPPSAFRTIITDANHYTLSNEGQWYSVPEAEVEKVFLAQKALRKYHKRQIDAFGECCFMIRRPFLDMVNCLKNARSDWPANRYIIHGKYGTGKSVLLAQLTHYAHSHGWIVCNTPHALALSRNVQEIAMSTYRPGRVDLPLEASDWLNRFLILNRELLDEAELKTSQEYKWSDWESLPANELLTKVADTGLSRIKFASDCVGVILKELKIASTARRVKTLVIIGEANVMFQDSRIKREDRSLVPADSISLVHAMRKMFHTDWCNGAAVLSTDARVEGKTNLPSHDPIKLLGEEGFDSLDPFVPISVENYNEKEMHSIITYYTDRNWLQRVGTERGRKQFLHLSAKNPFLVQRMSAVW